MAVAVVISVGLPFLEANHRARDFNMTNNLKDIHSDSQIAIIGKRNDCISKAILDLTALLGTKES